MSLKKSIVLAVSIVSLLVGCVGWASAATLSSDRNSETDMKDSQVWIRQTPNCVVVKSASTLQPTTIAQPAVGVRPSMVVDLTGKEGAFALVDQPLLVAWVVQGVTLAQAQTWVSSHNNLVVPV